MRVRPVLLRVHRWLALLAAIPLALAAATGALLVFEGEIDRALNRDYWSVQPQTGRLPWQAVVAAAERAKSLSENRRGLSPFSESAEKKGTVPLSAGGFRIGSEPHEVATSLRLPSADDVAAEVILKSGLQVSVDPYSGRVLGSRRREQVLMAAVHQFHTRLLLGEWGSRIMGVSGLALVFLSLTGLVLWWPQKRFWIRWTGSWRSWGRDLHYGLGIVGLVAWLLLGLTGAGIAFESLVRPALYYLTGSKPNEQPVVQSTPGAGTARLTVDEALAAAERALPEAETTVISLPTTPAGTFMAYMKFPEDHTPAGRSRVIVDQYSGRALWVENSRTTALGTRIWIKNRPLHTGDIFGWPTRLLAAAACLALLVQLVTGIVMWRPRGKRKESVTA